MIACGGLSPGEGLDTWDIKDGSSVTANWDNWIQGHRGKHIHAAGAMGYGTWESTYPTGPIMEYMAECPTGDCNGVDAFSLDWFKISEASWDGTQWPTEQVNQTKSWTFSIPQGVKSGFVHQSVVQQSTADHVISAYLVRHEIVAMHIPGSPQVYPVCFQANLVSSGTGTPNETVTFPDAYAKFDQGFREIDIYWEGNPKNPAIFVPPGPRIASLGGSLALDTPAVSTTLSDAVSVGSIVVGGHISTSTATALPISDVEAVSTGPVESAPAYAVTDSAATDYTAPQESKAAVSAGDTSSQSGTHAQSIATGRGGRSRGS